MSKYERVNKHFAMKQQSINENIFLLQLWIRACQHRSRNPGYEHIPLFHDPGPGQGKYQ